MRHAVGLVIGLVVLWLLLSGHYSPLLLGLGAVSCALTVWFCHRLSLIDEETVPLAFLPRILPYCAWLALEIAKSNWDVAWRIVWPGRHYSPTIVELRARQSTAFGQMVFANSITLTPGTVTVGLRDSVAEVHALTAIEASDLEDGTMDQRVRWLEGRRDARPGLDADD